MIRNCTSDSNAAPGACLHGTPFCGVHRARTPETSGGWSEFVDACPNCGFSTPEYGLREGYLQRSTAATEREAIKQFAIAHREWAREPGRFTSAEAAAVEGALNAVIRFCEEPLVYRCYRGSRSDGYEGLG